MDELAWNQFKHSRRRWLFSSRPFYSKIGTLLERAEDAMQKLADQAQEQGLGYG